MKNKFLLFLIIVIFTLILPSCKANKDNNNDNPPSNEQNGIENREVIYIVIPDELAETNEYQKIIGDVQTQLLNAEVFYGSLVLSENDAKAKHEIVIGETSRAISAEAYEKLSKIRVEEEDEDDYILGYCKYLIYAKDGSIAVAFENDEELAAQKTVITALLNDIISTDVLSVKDGILCSGVVDIYKFIADNDAKELEKSWEKLEIRLGTEATAAMKDLYELYTDDMISWLANLWEPYTCNCKTEECTNSSPYCGGGAFYYSNSGRDTEGFLPDSESTRQVLSFLEQSGMVGNYAKSLPEDMKNSIIHFLKSLQDAESGYFYHPQWGDSIQNSRRGRDLGDCTGILTKLGSAPTYNAPDGTAGDGILADGSYVTGVSATSSLTAMLGLDTAKAASKVIAVATTVSHLQNKEAFEAYLESLNIREESYKAGNELAAQTSEIQARDRELRAEGKNYSLMSILIKFLNENQNPDTGNWDWSNQGVYHGNNGVLKITLVYNNAKAPVPNATKLIYSAIDTLLAPETPGAVVDVYNVWYALMLLQSNIKAYGDGLDAVTEFENELYANAPTLISATKNKLAIFQKPDGSFSYYQKYSSSTSQAAAVALPQSEEGDVNATTIAAGGTIGTMFSALGLSNYKPAIYTSSDYKRFISIIEGLDKVIKDEIAPFEATASGDENKGKGKYYESALHFDGNFTDTVASGVFESQSDLINMGRLGVGAYIGTAEVNGDKIMAYGKTIGGSPYLYINLMNGKNGNAIIFESDVCLIGGSTNYDNGVLLEMYLDNDNITNADMWWNGTMSLVEGETLYDGDEPILQHGFGPSQKKHAVKYGTWHNMRLEVQNSAAAGSEIRFYLDNVLMSRKYVTSPTSKIEHLAIRFRGDSPADSLVLFDNMFFGTFDSIPTDDTVLIPDNIVVQDSAHIISGDESRGSGEHADKAETYADTNLTTMNIYGQIGSQSGKIVLDTASQGEYAKLEYVKKNEALLLGSTGTTDPYFYFFADGNDDRSDKSLVFETDFAIPSGTVTGRNDTNFIEFYASKSATEANHWWAMGFVIGYKNGKYYLFGEEIDPSRWYNLRIEVDDISTVGSEIRYYVNGTLKKTVNSTSAADYIPNMMVRFVWQCTDGKIYFDNTYFKAPVPPASHKPVKPDQGGTVTGEVGTGLYADDAIKFDDTTLEELADGGTVIPVDSKATASIVTVNDNKVLKLRANGTYYSRYSLKSAGSLSGATGMIFETDILLDGCSGNFNFMPTSTLTGNATIYGGYIGFAQNENGVDYNVYLNNSSSGFTYTIAQGEWINLRVEYVGLEANKSVMKLYVNGEFIGETALTKTLTDAQGLQLQLPTSNGINGDVYFDNVYLAYVGDEGDPTPPEVEEPNEPSEPDSPTPPVATEDYYGKGAYTNDENTLTFDGKSISEISSITRVGSGIDALVTSLGGKDTLKFSIGWSGHAYDRYSIAKVGSENNLVFETDVYIPSYSSSIGFSIMAASNLSGNAGIWHGIINFAYDTESERNYVYIKGAAEKANWFILPEGKWANIRVEYDSLDPNGAIRLIANGETIAETTLSGSMKGMLGMQIQFPGTFVGTVYFDNVYCGDKLDTVQGEGTDEPNEPITPPSPEDPSNNRGSGKYADNAITYDGKAFTEITEITHKGSGVDASIEKLDENDAAKFTVGWSGHAYDRYSIARVGTENNLVFETDVYIPTYSSTLNFSIMATSNLSGDAGIWHGIINFAYDAESGKNYVYLRGAAEKENWFVLPRAEWCNIRVEYDSLDPNGAFRLVANGELIVETALSGSMQGMQGMQIQFPGAFVGTVYFDNTYCGTKINE